MAEYLFWDLPDYNHMLEEGSMSCCAPCAKCLCQRPAILHHGEVYTMVYSHALCDKPTSSDLTRLQPGKEVPEYVVWVDGLRCPSDLLHLILADSAMATYQLQELDVQDGDKHIWLQEANSTYYFLHGCC
jgi:hypothetical protein